MNFIVILIFLLTYPNSTIKFTGDGDIKLSQLDAFLEAFVDEVFIFFQEYFLSEVSHSYHKISISQIFGHLKKFMSTIIF